MECEPPTPALPTRGREKKESPPHKGREKRESLHHKGREKEEVPWPNEEEGEGKMA